MTFSGAMSYHACHVHNGLLLPPMAMSGLSMACIFEVLGHCFAPPSEDSPHFKHIKSQREGKSVLCNKGKGHTKPMDEDKDEGASGDLE